MIHRAFKPKTCLLSFFIPIGKKVRQLKIKKVDDKPIIIHAKSKPKIHSHEVKSTGIKGHNVYSVKRSPKIMSATTTTQTMGKGAVRRRGKTTYRKSTIHQNQEKRRGRINQHNRNIKDDKKTIKTKNSSIKLVGAVGANVAANQMEGADEIRDASMIAYGVTRPMTGAASKGAEFFRQKSLAEKKRKIKKVESGRKLSRRQIKKTTQKVAKKAAKDTAKKVAKETAKKTAVLKSANMSLGINTLMKLLQDAAKVLATAGFDMEIVERHHKLKLDAPSGTALALADSMKEVLDDDYFYRYDRSQLRQKRDPKEIGISAVRG